MKLMRMLGTSLALAGLGLGVASTALAQVPAKKPNILFIVSDDTGYGDLGPYGGGEFGGALADLCACPSPTRCS